MQMEIGNKGAICSELSGSGFLIPLLPPLRASASFPRGDPVPVLSSHCCHLSAFSALPPDLCQREMEGAVLSHASCNSAAETCESGQTCPYGMAVFALLAGFPSEPHSNMAENHPRRTPGVYLSERGPPI